MAADAHGARLGALAAALRERGLDALLVSAPANVRYLTGFTGSNGLALVLADGAGAFFTDFRYQTQAAGEVAAALKRWPIPAKAPPADLVVRAAEALGATFPDEVVPGARPAAPALADSGRLGFDESHLTVARHARLAELLGGRWELQRGAGIVERLREVKDEQELARIAAAAQLADEALRSVVERGLAGRTERELAIELDLAMRRLGGEASFPTIVAAGAHGALPHATPRDAEIPPGVLVTIDWGALYEGYCSDCTRTFATGPVSERAQEVYALVLRAQQAALDALAAGRTGVAVDATARELIAAAGHAERFGHGLGHGVGLEVHEAPRLSPAAGEEPLRAGSVVTVEPGVYIPGELGVRIEDLVVLEESGARVLSSVPKALTVTG